MCHRLSQGWEGGTQAIVGALQMSSAIAPPTRTYIISIKSPTFSPVPGPLQLCIKVTLNTYLVKL